MWQIVQQGLVRYYGMLEEFVTSVTEMVPELLSYKQRVQLVLGLRARLVLELCHSEPPADHETIQPHLDRITALTTPMDDNLESEANFVELVQTLLEDPSEREHFFKEVFPEHYGPKYDKALEMLGWSFFSRLEELLPVPDFEQMVSWLGAAPSVLEECLQSASPPKEMNAVLQHHRHLGHMGMQDTCPLPMEDFILSSLSLPLITRVVIPADPYSKVSTCLEKEGPSDVPIDQSHLWRGKTEDLSFPANEIGPSWSERRTRKRKLSDSLEIPPKQPTDSALFPDSVDLEHYSDSPIISIWGEYTDTKGVAYPLMTDAKVSWSDDETLNLIDIWGKNSVQRVLKGCIKNRHIFALISKKMSERGYVRTVEQCQTRIKRLKKCFRQCLQHNSGNNRLECKFYDQLEKILGTVAPSTVPEVTYDIEETLDGEQPPDSEDWKFLSHSVREDIETRSVPWTDMETHTLINIWGEDRMQSELRGMHRNGHIFAVISKKMSAQGFTRSVEQCQTRVKRLKASFRQCYENNMNGREQVECKFYDQLERILVNELPSYVAENSLDMELESQQGQTTDNEFSVYTYQEMEAAVSGPDERKKIPWADGETLTLLELWGDERVQQNLRLCPHNGHIYSEISEKLKLRDYCRTAEQCHTRIKRLKASFRQCQESISLSGSERIDFKFYDLLEQILQRQSPSTSTAAADMNIDITEESNSASIPETEWKEVDSNTTSKKTILASWSDSETQALLDIWGEEVRRVGGFVHHGHVYADMSEQMHNLGFRKTPEQCSWKVKSMRDDFHQRYDRKECGIIKEEYQFYSQLERILEKEAACVDQHDEGEDEAERDADSDDGMRSAPWSEPETLALIEVWGNDQVQRSLRAHVGHHHIFASISEKLAIMGHLKTGEQCHSRVLRLRKTYRQCRNSRSSGGEPQLFRYYRFLEPVLGEDADHADVYGDFPEHPTEEADQDTQGRASASHAGTESSRKMQWSDRETQALLEVWGEDHVQLTLRGCLKNRHVFEYISQSMIARGFGRTAEQCHTRVKRLKASFLHDKECKFYGQMEEIFTRELCVDSVDVLDTEECAVPLHAEPDQKKANPQIAEGSKFAWSDSETQVLLDIWGSDDVQENLKGSTKNKHIFTQISRAMASQGYQRTAEQCQSRVKRLKANFRQCCESKKSGGVQVECKFYDQLQILGNKHVTVDPLVEDYNGATAEDSRAVPDEQGHGTGSPGSSSSPSPWEPDLKWSIEETELLLNIWGSEKLQEDLRKDIEQEYIYTEISDKMVEEGFVKTAKQCQSRVAQLNLCVLQSDKEEEGARRDI